MKTRLIQFLRFTAYLILFAFLGVLLHNREYVAAWGVAFATCAALTPWAQHIPGACFTNTIPDGLKLTRVLNNALVGFRTALAPLRLFSHAVSRDAHTPGNDDLNSITVPVYAWSSGDAQTRTPGQAYSGKVSSTTTGSRKISIDTEKVVGISFTNEEAQNQVAFDPVRHGLIKGHDLARTVVNLIFAKFRYGNFPNATLSPMAPSTFDENDVADLAQKAMEANWPDMPARGLALNPAFHFNLVKQGAIIGVDKSGSQDALREARVGRILGFDEVGTNGIPLNNDSGQTFTAATSDVCTAVAHGLLTGDQVVVSSETTLPAGLSASTYYYVGKIDADTFKLYTTMAAAVAAGTAVNITDTGTGDHTIFLQTNLVGVAGTSDAVITGFRPVMPTKGIRQKLVDFRLVNDDESDLTLEYRHIADEDLGKEYQIIGCHFGSEYGIAEAAMLLSKSL